jgi:enoyl-CoA hydratase
MSAEPAVRTERRDGVLLVTLNRPHVLNAVNSELGEGLLAAVELLDRTDELKVGVITGAGRAFCAGMDLKAFTVDGDPRGLKEFVQRESRKPLIVAVEGFAVAGGLEICLACDVLVAARGAKLGIPEVTVGLFAAGGGVARLPHRVPYSVAMLMALSGDPITAEQAFQHGLVTLLCEPGEALRTALDVAGRIAANSPLGVLESKRLMRETVGRTEAEFWTLQDDALRRVLASDDAREGATAFAQKRPPNWSGR